MAYIDKMLLKIAFYKGYCTIYSNYYVIEQAKQQVADELSEKKRKITNKKVDLSV